MADEWSAGWKQLEKTFDRTVKGLSIDVQFNEIRLVTSEESTAKQLALHVFEKNVSTLSGRAALAID